VTDSQHHSFVNSRVLKFNVGYLLAETVGYQRDIDIDLPRVRVADDLELDFLRGALRFSRNSQGVLVRARFETHILTECARCLDLVFYPVELEIEELFVYPPAIEALYRVEETGILDLAPLLREEAILAVPMGVLCQPDCAGLCPQCGQNWNEGPCDCEQDDIDPRLAVLRAHLDSQRDDRPDDHADD
jgi:uncharacterized protein